MSDISESEPGAPLRIVGVHGVHHFQPQRTPDEAAAGYARAWTGHLARALNIAPERFEMAFGYYAPALRRPGPSAQGPGEEDTLDDPLAAEMLAAYLEALDAPATVSQGAATLPLRHAAAWIAKRFPGTTQAFVRVFFREVAEYLRSPDHPGRLEARETVRRLVAEHKPDIVIAHSLGTVVTYEALHALPDQSVPLLLTLGSPLALPHAVHPRLLPTPAHDPARGLPFGSRPPGVRRWINIADPGDPVAIPPGLATGFDGITLDLTDTVHHTVGFHNAANYLGAAATVATLAPYSGL